MSNHVLPDAAIVAQGDQIRARTAEQLHYLRLYRAGTVRDMGDYVGTGTVVTRLLDGELSRFSLVTMLVEAMRQLDEVDTPPEGSTDSGTEQSWWRRLFGQS